ncbi:MAG: RNA polymerase sigma factor [Candidatus Zixiibacteriota bacterium]
MNTLEDRLLVEAVVAGEKQAFCQLVEQFQRLVSHIVFQIVSEREDREDLCQEVFMKVYKHISSFEYQSKLSTWIGRIAYNASLNYLQKKRIPLVADLVDSSAASVDSFASENVLPDEFARRSDVAAILRRHINCLQPQYRTIVTLYHLDDMSYHEIAEITGLPDGTVKSHLFRARKQLRESLSKHYTREELCA